MPGFNNFNNDREERKLKAAKARNARLAKAIEKEKERQRVQEEKNRRELFGKTNEQKAKMERKAKINAQLNAWTKARSTTARTTRSIESSGSSPSPRLKSLKRTKFPSLGMAPRGITTQKPKKTQKPIMNNKPERNNNNTASSARPRQIQILKPRENTKIGTVQSSRSLNKMQTRIAEQIAASHNSVNSRIGQIEDNLQKIADKLDVKLEKISDSQESSLRMQVNEAGFFNIPNNEKFGWVLRKVPGVIGKGVLAPAKIFGGWVVEGHQLFWRPFRNIALIGLYIVVTTGGVVVLYNIHQRNPEVVDIVKTMTRPVWTAFKNTYGEVFRASVQYAKDSWTDIMTSPEVGNVSKKLKNTYYSACPTTGAKSFFDPSRYTPAEQAHIAMGCYSRT